MKYITCIVCPKGCSLSVDEENGYAVTGNSCPRGAAYGKEEATMPTRVLTSTVIINGARYKRCPVRTRTAIPKAKLFDAMKELENVALVSPVKRGDIALKNIAGSNVDVIVTKDM